MRFLLLASLLALPACEKSHPPSSSSQGTAPSGLPQGELPPPPSPSASAATPDDPHGGAMGGAMGGAIGGGMRNPHVGGMPGDPHAGLEMEGGGASPAAKEVDPNMVLEGTISVSPKLKDKVKEGDILFLSVKSVDEAGTPQRIPIAADRRDASAFPMPFKLTGANTMMQGTKFEGDVLITVRVDRDGEAMSRKAGDIEGSVRAKIPTRGLKIILDTPIPDR